MPDASASSPVSAGHSSPTPLQFLRFELEGIRIALPVSVIQEVVRAVAVSPLPEAPTAVEGVINFRGTLVPVFDLRRRFGLPPSSPSLHHHFVIAQAGPRLATLRVNRVLDLVEVAPADLAQPEDVVSRAGHVSSFARLPDGLLVIQDLERFLSESEAEQVDAAVHTATPSKTPRAPSRAAKSVRAL